MVELVTIPASFFELIAEYERPAIHLLIDRGAVVQAIFDALKPWNPRIDDIESHTTGKHSEQGVTFRLPTKHVSFFFGAAACRFARDAVDWTSAEETINMLDTCLSALLRHAGVAWVTQKTAIGVHIQPRTKNFVDILRPFLVHELAMLDQGPLQTMAVVAKWGKRRLTLDGSGLLANALFVKLEREFETSISYEAMAQQLHADEEELFRILGIEEERG
ncbi:MAG TPA: hypothetical protein VN841_16115 [Bryobacteraceae bacterium]|nr:hypothetical protein [Bryobacteraceae bacterium]